MDGNQHPAAFSAEFANGGGPNISVLIEDDYRIVGRETWAKSTPHRFSGRSTIVKIHDQNTYFPALPLDLGKIEFLTIGVQGAAMHLQERMIWPTVRPKKIEERRSVAKDRPSRSACPPYSSSSSRARRRNQKREFFCHKLLDSAKDPPPDSR
jgi:hypothetical protein